MNESEIDWQNDMTPEPPDLPGLRTEALKIYEVARGVQIANTEERIIAEATLVKIKKTMNSFKDLLNPGIDAARSALNVLKDKKKEIMDPLSAAEGAVKQCLGAYYQKEEAERRRIQAIEDKRIADARKKEKDAMAAVLEAERKGDMEKADRILKERAEEETKTAVLPPPDIPIRPPEKMKGISSRMIPKWVVTDPSKLPVAYREIVPIKPKITGLIKALGPKEAMRLCPGIRAWEESSTTVKV